MRSFFLQKGPLCCGISSDHLGGLGSFCQPAIFDCILCNTFNCGHSVRGAPVSLSVTNRFTGYSTAKFVTVVGEGADDPPNCIFDGKAIAFDQSRLALGKRSTRII